MDTHHRQKRAVMTLAAVYDLQPAAVSSLVETTGISDSSVRTALDYLTADRFVTRNAVRNRKAHNVYTIGEEFDTRIAECREVYRDDIERLHDTYARAAAEDDPRRLRFRLHAQFGAQIVQAVEANGNTQTNELLLSAAGLRFVVERDLGVTGES